MWPKIVLTMFMWKDELRIVILDNHNLRKKH